MQQEQEIQMKRSPARILVLQSSENSPSPAADVSWQRICKGGGCANTVSLHLSSVARIGKCFQQRLDFVLNEIRILHQHCFVHTCAKTSSAYTTVMLTKFSPAHLEKYSSQIKACLSKSKSGQTSDPQICSVWLKQERKSKYRQSSFEIAKKKKKKKRISLFATEIPQICATFTTKLSQMNMKRRMSHVGCFSFQGATIELFKIFRFFSCLVFAFYLTNPHHRNEATHF